MRFTVVKIIYEAALKNKKIFFLTGDLGHACEKEFKKNIPNQYINCGIAEQNMLGLAAGLALSGMKVFVYSISPFVTMRCFEQVKNDVCYQNVDVNIIGVGGGFTYGPYGNTHCSIEDIAVMRVLPNMKIVCPANPLETEQLTKQILNARGPIYMRIGRGKEPIPQKRYSVTFGKGYKVKDGKDGVIITAGTILTECERTIELLAKRGLNFALINMHTIKPIDKDLVVDILDDFDTIFTVEEHSIIGGLGSAIAEIISEETRKNIRFKRFGVRDSYLHEIGSQEYLRDKHGISAQKIATSIIRSLQV